MTRDLSDVTALIITIGRDPYLLECVGSLRRHYPEILIYVGDQNPPSVHRTNQMIKAGVNRIVQLDWDCGVPIARNRVLEFITTPYLLLADDDFYFTTDSNLNAIRELAELYHIAGGGLILNNKPQRYEGFVNKVGNKLVWTRLVDPDEWMHPPFSAGHSPVWNPDLRYWPVDLTLNFFIAFTNAVKVIEWDENIKVSYEHTDFFLRMKNAGFTCAFTPDSTAVHKPPHVTLDPAQERSYLRTRKRRDDREYFFRKWGVDTLIDFNGNVDRLKK